MVFDQFDAAVSLSATALPTGVSASFNPQTIAAPGAGKSTLTLTAGAAAVAGTYTVNITATGGGVTRTSSVQLVVTSGGGGPSFSLSANPASLTVTQGGSGSSTITAAISGGFNAAVSLTAVGLPAGVTASFNPVTIPAPGSGSSGLMLAVSGTAATGTYSFAVSGTGGGLTEQVTLSLTISSAGGTQLITDGGFESATKSGLTAPGWTATTNEHGQNIIIVKGSYPHSGSNYAELGGANNDVQSLTQTVSIPAGSTSVTLTFWVNITTQETNGNAYDYLYVDIANTSGVILGTPLTLNNTNSTADGNTLGVYFQPQSVNLSSYAGETIEIMFHATTDYEKTTTFLIDDVSIVATPAL